MDQFDTNDLLRRLQQWYASQCNGDWEHGWGIEIRTLDNPGWSVKINIAETLLSGKAFQSTREPVQQAEFEKSNRWLDCHLKDGIWKGYGDESKLAQILEVFLDWAESN